METPLHLLSRVDLSIESFKDFTRIRWGRFSGCVRNKDGLTPVLKAAQENNLPLVRLLCTMSESLAFEAKKDDGQIFWHLLASQPSVETDYGNPTLDQFLTSFHDDDGFPLRSTYHQRQRFLDEISTRDNCGNTPVHLAIEKGNFRFAQFYIDFHRKTTWGHGLTVQNKKGITPAALIGFAEHIPREFENFLWRDPELVKDLLGVRSLSGLSTTMIKDYTNTLGVVAALLATITFTAAFTVPGGLNANNGTPFFMDKTAFQVFLVSDVLAMCLSMMVLFCLLWIMTMGNKKESVVLLDLTVLLLQLSFYATLLAFMTGLYVTTFPVASWIAILSCALCSSLILFMHKGLIAFCIPTIIKIFFVSRQAASLFRQFLYLILCLVPKRAMICRSSQQRD